MTTRASDHVTEIELQPVRAAPPRLSHDMFWHDIMQAVLGEVLSQFTRNLNALRVADDAELVHQARVAWRRFKTLTRLFNKDGVLPELPDLKALQPLVEALSALRDVDVARLDTLPQVVGTWAAGDRTRVRACAQLQKKLELLSARHLTRVRRQVRRPATGAALLALTRWLTQLPVLDRPPADWAERHLERLERRLQAALRQTDTPASLHVARIRAKRMRYSLESLQSLLPEKQVRHGLKTAARIQTTLGNQRDWMQLAALAEQLHAAQVLRGYLDEGV